MNNTNWIFTNDDAKFFRPTGTTKYVEITLSNARINQLMLEAIETFNKNNPPVKKTRIKANKDFGIVKEYIDYDSYVSLDEEV